MARPSIAEKEAANAPNFNLVARPYRWMEYLSFGPLLERCRFAQLDRLGNPQHALVLGDGDGRFAARLLQQYPDLIVDLVDLSPAMMSLALERIQHAGAAGRVKYTIADIRSFFPANTSSYDLVATHFFLDCFSNTELQTIFDNISPALAQGCTWIVSDFAIPSRQPVRLAARILVSSLYFAFRLLTGLRTRHLPDHAAFFAKAGFECVHSHSSIAGILRSEVWRHHS